MATFAITRWFWDLDCSILQLSSTVTAKVSFGPRNGTYANPRCAGKVIDLSCQSPLWLRIYGEHAMPKSLFLTLLIVGPILVIAMSGSFLLGMLAFVSVLIANPIVRSIRRARYFGSEHFKGLRAEVAALVSERNAVVDYVSEMRAEGSFELGASTSGQYAHLAGFVNESRWNNRRDRHVVDFAPHVHHASLQVVRNAKIEPIKYLMKYFGIKADHATLAEVQRVSEDIARLEEAVANVRGREADLTARIAPPKFILKHYSAEFWDQLGVHLTVIQVPYPRYRFEYTSAGGNSSQSAPIQLDTPTLEALSQVLVAKIRWAKSAAGQRALMTGRLRTFIKSRDNHACRYCKISVAAEPHLLLEVDHIVPVSRGGLSTPENLQTLCWRCNRTKGAKIVA
ncbi:HNH endonuclease [Curtobacterium flaccumfaciens pv. flaccumfaciens]|uniref:HNH endonuclease n=1 Tax=Curtobacterium poinsettiae TaxID=159612 RepID=UPI00217E7C28|nr:HNH endonuclease signature motif containing protein [Curtobacterium flaccumfaciens]MCS6574211.1 HNH endonuclease [Curtobacterium flaccumfaciens pv. flaccumfaciens]